MSTVKVNVVILLEYRSDRSRKDRSSYLPQDRVTSFYSPTRLVHGHRRSVRQSVWELEHSLCSISKAFNFRFSQSTFYSTTAGHREEGKKVCLVGCLPCAIKL